MTVIVHKLFIRELSDIDVSRLLVIDLECSGEDESDDDSDGTWIRPGGLPQLNIGFEQTHMLNRVDHVAVETYHPLLNCPTS